MASAPSTKVYQNGTLLTALPTVGIAWLDDGHLLTDVYALPQGSQKYVFASTAIYSPQGNVLSAPPLPQLNTVQVLSPTSLYSPDLNQILSVTTGLPTWASGNPPHDTSQVGYVGTVAGSQVIFTSGAQVLAQPH
jgi:hypothetical protein